MAGGEDDVAASILKEYTSKMPLVMSNLNNAVIAGDYEGVNFAAHKLKSSFEYLGITELAALMIEIENVCKIKYGIKWVAANLNTIKSVYETASMEIEQELVFLEG